MDGDVSNEVFDDFRDEPQLSKHDGVLLRAPLAGLMSQRYAASARESCFAMADRASESRLPLRTNRRSSSPGSGGLLQGEQSSHQRAAQLTVGLGVRQQQRPAASGGCIRRTAVVLADDRFDRGDDPEPACA